MGKKLIKPNAKTIEAMLEARAGKLQSFNSVDELMTDLGAKVKAKSIRIEEDLYLSARDKAKAENRTIAEQIEFWAKVGRTALDNPDLPARFIADVLISMSEPSENAIPYHPGLFK